MILAFDIGNTHVVTGLYSEEGERLLNFRAASGSNLTEDQFFSYIKNISDFHNISLSTITGVVISSVVPTLTTIFVWLSKKYFNCDPLIITAESKIPFTFAENITSPYTMGADRIVDISEALFNYPDKDMIIIDFGTATTFEVVKNKEYLGGCILPGVNMSIEALFSKTSKLPKVRFQRAESALGLTTAEQINAGIYFGTLGQVKELIKNYSKLLNNPYIISTGGLGKVIAEEIELIDEYIENLAVDGLYSLYKYNKNS